MAEEYSFVYTYQHFLIHSFIGGHLGCFHSLVVVNNAVKNVGLHVFFQGSVLGFFGYVPRSRIAGS